MSNPYEKTRDTNSSVLGPTLKFKGKLTAKEDLLIQGRVEGTIKHSSSLTIGEGGHVKADVTAEYIAVEGRVEGDLKGGKSVKVRESAKINGNIFSPKVSLVEGATFNGQVDMDNDPNAKIDKKPEKHASGDVVAKRDEPSAAKPRSQKKAKRTDKKSADAA